MPQYTIGDNFNPKHSITNRWWGLGLWLRAMIITIYTSCTFNAMGSKMGCYSFAEESNMPFKTILILL